MNKMSLQAVFIDRDGTIGGTGHFIHPCDFELYPGVEASLIQLKKAGLQVFALTNQHRISRGQATEEQFHEQFAQFGFDQAYICPHSSSEPCLCRKPGTAMLEQAASEHGLDLRHCAVIGDVGSTDMLAAAKVGAVKILVRTGWGEQSLGDYRHTWAETEPDYVAKDLPEAVSWLLQHHK
ncbi:HAD-IIIA family hydrolase [Paenibacillus sp. J2TS4]|uniref:HAD-IIIA family hydrolase n=1 Tax=Paenibacillus sp. J2TS4 TaxID=2807194 RepID=UPI001B1BC6A2|nr:HAD-IIIA family hydrolase [Paenibacillus sp. J2TS4]GIP33941.1 D,D-heptose 1,7-bisphosphate phosphatase [Paenibacillus sp. J2TS4]